MKISDVARMLGLPVETIRFYEKEGIVQPQRNDSSGYREYDFWDVFKLVACITYRNMGMSVKEIARFIHSGTREELIEHLSREQDALWQEVEEKEYLRSVLNQYERKLKYLPWNIGNFWIVSRDAFSYIAGVERNGPEYSQRPVFWEKHAEWLQKMPAVRNMQLISVEALESDPDCNQDIWCCAVETHQMRRLGLQKNQDVSELPEAICMVTILDGGEIGTLTSDLYRNLLSTVREKGYTPYGTITSELLVRCWEGEVYHRYFEVMIPVTKTEN